MRYLIFLFFFPFSSYSIEIPVNVIKEYCQNLSPEECEKFKQSIKSEEIVKGMAIKQSFDRCDVNPKDPICSPGKNKGTHK